VLEHGQIIDEKPGRINQWVDGRLDNQAGMAIQLEVECEGLRVWKIYLYDLEAGPVTTAPSTTTGPPVTTVTTSEHFPPVTVTTPVTHHETVPVTTAITVRVPAPPSNRQLLTVVLLGGLITVGIAFALIRLIGLEWFAKRKY